MLVDDVVNETCYSSLSFTNHIHKLHNALMCLFFDAYLFTILAVKSALDINLSIYPTFFSAWDDTVTFTVD